MLLIYLCLFLFMAFTPVVVLEIESVDLSLSSSGLNDEKIILEKQDGTTRNNYDDIHDSKSLRNDAINGMSESKATATEEEEEKSIISSHSALESDISSSACLDCARQQKQQQQYDAGTVREESDPMAVKEEDNVDDFGKADATHTLTHDSDTTAGKTEEMLQEEIHGNDTVTLNIAGADDAEDISSTSQPKVGSIDGEGPHSTDKKKEDSHTSRQTASDHAESTPPETKPQVIEDEDEDDHHVKSVNYAHKNAGAIILSSSPSFKGTSNLLVSDNDKYAIAPCADKKAVVISLSEDILVKEVVLSNFEKYSSSVKEFQILGSQDYDARRPNAHWHDLGTFTAKPTSGGEEKFTLLEPSWARYLKFRFLTHYGHEHYCTVTQIKVQGSTMVQGFHEQWKESEKELEELRRGVIDTNIDNIDGVEESQIYSDIEETASTEDFSERIETDSKVSGQDLNSFDISKVGNVSTSSNESNVVEVAAESISSETVEDGSKLNGKSNETERSPSLVASKDEYDEKAHEISSKEAFSDQSLAQREVDTDNMKIFNTTSEENKISKGDDILEDVQATMGSYVADENMLAEELISNKVKGTTQTVTIASGLPLSNVTTLPHDEASTSEFESESGATASTTTDTVAVSVQKDLVTERTIKEPEIAIPSKNVTGLDEASSTKKVLSVEEHVHNASGKEKPVSEDIQKTPIEGEPKTPLDSIVKESSMQNLIQREHLESNKAIAAIIEKYPGAKCLQNLSLSDFKSKFQARATKAKQSNEPGGTAPTSLKIEPIFKTLTDEIKALQVHMSVYDQYIVDLTSCYQIVMMLMVADSQKQEKAQAARLALMEKRLDEIYAKQNSNFAGIPNIIHDALKNVLNLQLGRFSFYINALYHEGRQIFFNTGIEIYFLLFFFVVVLKILCWMKSSRRTSPPQLHLKEEPGYEKCNDDVSSAQIEGARQFSQSYNNGKKRKKSKTWGKAKFNGDRISMLQ
jgi:hypothetical protein